MSAREHDVTTLRGAIRAALPLFAGQAVVFGVAFAQKPALLIALDPAEIGEYGLLNEALRWAVVLGSAGLGVGLLRLAPERPAERRSLLATLGLAVGLTSVVATTLILAVPALRTRLLGTGDALDAFAIYGWRIPCICLLALIVTSLHAEGRLRSKAALDALHVVLVAIGAVVGAFTAGLQGLVVGSVLASLVAVVAAFVVGRPRTGGPWRPRPGLLRPAFQIGRMQLAYQLTEIARRLAVLRIVAARSDSPDVAGHFYAAMMLTLPLIAVPEMVAQAVYPRLLDASGETADVDRTHTRILRGTLLAGAPLLLAYGALLALLLPLIREGRYADAVMPALALLPGVAAHGLTALSGYVVLVRLRLAEAVGIALIALLVASAAAWWALPLWGATGAAGAMSLALVVRGILLIALARRGRRPTAT